MSMQAREKEWRAHPNFSGPASTLLIIHHQFRVASERLLLFLEREGDALPNLGFVGRAFAPLATTLHHHHHAEEQMLFPMIAKRTGTPPSRLESDHQELTRSIEAVEKALVGSDNEIAMAAARAFDVILREHLDREEELVVPVLLEMKPDEAWALIHGQM
jgi:hypothetical protein